MKRDNNTDHSHIIHVEDDDDSGSEGDDLLNERDYLRNPTEPKKAGFLVVLEGHRWLIDTFLLLVIVALVFERSWTPRCDRDSLEGNGDITGFAPFFSQQIRKFSPDPGFVPENTSEFFSEETKQRWLDILPKGLGYLEVKDPEKYNSLPTQLTGFDGQFVVTTSMTHQLHCLHAIAEAYSALTSDTSRVPEETPWHLTHCFDYIRQGIMCCGDVALEGEQTTFPEGFDGSDGWDAKHVCKDYDQILAYLNESRANDEVWV
ncbi:hypothetical protein SAMD00023353_1700980 [Rosellinia necatrix]|uniref:Oxidase ustYa n=1 Tax=Rosellinia necatrix TaxID=77044 RepID=A0A1W2TKP5_ROSNE|nr:hypothetical protein SAMD00023353_1700980 [Rosellinia necatrix]